MKTITEVRNAFWDAHPLFQYMRKKSWRQNDYNTNVRCAFVEFVDRLRKDGQVKESLATRVTL